MATERKKPAKSETLTIRLDPKTRFMLEFMSRLRGQTITTVVERAIFDAALQATIPDRVYGGTDDWRDFWSVHESSRALRIYACPELFPTFEEDRRLAFCRAHWPFFYADRKNWPVLVTFSEILWPRIDEFVALHEQTKSKDFFAAGRAMAAAISEAGVEPPDWPVPSPSKSKTELDDDIPF